MRSYLSLTKTFLAAVGMSKGQDKKRKILIICLSLFAGLFIMLPACFIAFLIMGMMTFSLMRSGSQAMGIELMLHIISIFTIIFGINVILNEFYFSNDIQFVLPWPVRASKLVAAKYTAAFFVENVMQILLVASCIAGFGMASRMSGIHWLYSLLGVLTLPLLPMAYCGILSILVMGFTRFIKNKDTMQRFSLSVIVLLLLAFVLGVGSLKELNVNNIIEAMVSGNFSFFKVMDVLFPNVHFFVKFFNEGDFLALLGYILVSLGAIAVMLALSEVLYFKGVIGLSSGSSKKELEGTSFLLAKSKEHSQVAAYLKKEILILFRTPTFFTHCILANFIWPLFVFAAYQLGIQTMTVADIFPKMRYYPQGADPINIAFLKEAYTSGSIRVHLAILFGVICLSLIVSSMNSISSSAISREGKHFSFMKYIPMSYEKQWGTKLLVGILFPALSFYLIFWPACIWFGIPLVNILFYTLISMVCILLPALTGISIDANQPKLIWDDELNALRENYNNFFSMSVAIGFAALLCITGYCLSKYLYVGITAIAWILFTLVIFLDLLFFLLAKKTVTKNIETQEEA